MVFLDTVAETTGLLEDTEYEPVPPTTETDPVAPHVSVIAAGATVSALGGGTTVLPKAVVTVMVVRLPSESRKITGTAARHTFGLFAVTVKRPGWAFGVTATTDTFGL